ncbi:MAG TPA: tRNA dihydrouridine synthase DusB [Phycisphaerales bacterium]|nr:tRNA dihydrouridine synthase DusB [Phycisphaerales bacterium]
MLRVGHVQLKSNLLLAPIAGYCDLAFRTICREYGGLGLACTDLLSPQGLLRGTATSLDLAQTNDFDKPIGMQLYGGDPAIMADGARWARDHGATVIDINMGCPVDKVTKKDGGSKLLCIPDTAEKVVEQVMSAVGAGPNPIPVTCKMRLGWFDDAPVAEWLAPRLIGAGACMITIHGRTTQQKFQGVVNHEGIKRVVKAVKAASATTPVIGNGDVTEPHHVLEMIAKTGCDGVMIGRGALSTPWLFRDAWSLQTTGALPAPPTRSEMLATVRRYFDLMREYRDDRYAMFQIRRRISWFAKRLGPCRSLRESVRIAPDPQAVYTALRAFEENPYPSRSENQPANDPEPSNAEAMAA